ncbi:MAG: RHS repeat domain-containing protein [Halodesulfovibrio sp.]|uniref:RHS repeat domain-containing protein n=1 Tax=Halodesulfovibrio sp. TaxID=1912772 RepID=UPI00359D2F17
MQQVRAMSTEEFLRKEVFRQPTKRTAGVGKGAVPQRGADDRMDMTPDSAPKYQKTEFRTRQGVVFGVMELFRNAEGQITQRNALFGKKNIVEYGYDEQGRLTAVRMNGFLTEQYNYGARGERLQELNGARYVYNYSSQLEQVRTPNGNIAFAYDQQGRRIVRRGAGGETSYHYNKYGLLEQVCTPDGRFIEYTYDPLGRRSFKAVNGKITEKYCWKDMLRLQAACTGEDEDHVVFKYAQSEKNALQPTSLTCKGKEYFLAYDHVGTILALSDETGLIVHVEETDSFGRRLSNHKLATVAMLSFGGGQLDEDTGLVHFLFRDYDPTTGLFIQKDPLGLRGGDVDVYGYCLDDPVNLVDPLGLKTRIHRYGGVPGHVSIDPGTGVAIGKYPKEGAKDAFWGDGEYRIEERPPLEILEIVTTPEQEAAIQQYLETVTGDKSAVRYNLPTENCVDAVDDALEAGGVDTPWWSQFRTPASYFNGLSESVGQLFEGE